MAKRDYYEVLGVTRSATEAEITKAYGGSGAKPGTQAVACKRCKGSGAEYVQAGGLFSFPQACRGCGGRGVVIPPPPPPPHRARRGGGRGTGAHHPPAPGA